MQTMKYEFCFNQREALKTTSFKLSPRRKFHESDLLATKLFHVVIETKLFIVTWHSNIKVNLQPRVSLSLKQTH